MPTGEAKMSEEFTEIHEGYEKKGGINRGISL